MTGETTAGVGAQQQILILGACDFRNPIAKFPEPFRTCHPSWMREIKAAPWPGADLLMSRAEWKHAYERAVIHKGNGPATQQIDIRAGGQKRCLRFQPPGECEIVVIHARDVYAARGGDSFIQSLCETAPILTAEDANAAIGQPRDLLRTSICRAIIHEKEFPIGESLLQQRAYGETQGGAAVMDGEQHADPWRIVPAMRAS